MKALLDILILASVATLALGSGNDECVTEVSRMFIKNGDQTVIYPVKDYRGKCIRIEDACEFAKGTEYCMTKIKGGKDCGCGHYFSDENCKIKGKLIWPGGFNGFIQDSLGNQRYFGLMVGTECPECEPGNPLHPCD